MSEPVTYTPAQCMDTAQPSTPGRCKGCASPILWGKTTTGKGAPFDVDPPHPNHFITCPERQRFKTKR